MRCTGCRRVAACGGALMGITIQDVQLAAHYAGLQVWARNNPDGGGYCIGRGRNILHHADDLVDVHGWLKAWISHVN